MATDLSELPPVHLSLEQYHALAGVEAIVTGPRLELLDGVLTQMSPQGNRHAAAIVWLTERLVKGVPEGFRVRPQLPLTFVEGPSEPEPDLAVIAPGTEAPFHPATAALAVEVADTTLRKDRLVKTRLYARAGVSEYWIVDVTGQMVEVHLDPIGELYARRFVARSGERIAVGAVPTLVIDVAALLAAR